MQTIHSHVSSIGPGPALPGACGAPSELLLLDIETTGLSALNHSIILIGCLCFDAGRQRWEITQFFADSPEEEPALLTAFSALAAGKRVLIHYNGRKFDLPFLQKHMKNVGIRDVIPGMQSVDIYQSVARYRNLLGLSDNRQQTVEAFLGTGRTDRSTGRDVVALYTGYLRDGNPDMRDAVIAHNAADLTGVLALLPMLSYDLFFQETPVVYRAEADSYSDWDGQPREEAILRFRSRVEIPKPVFGSRSSCFFKAEGCDGGTDGVVKVPILSGELKYFYANYRDYYYFPGQDQALHRSVAVYADRENRTHARPETCYTRKKASFLPEWDLFRTPFYKKDYRSPELYFELSPEVKTDRALLSSYAQYVVSHIIEDQR